MSSRLASWMGAAILVGVAAAMSGCGSATTATAQDPGNPSALLTQSAGASPTSIPTAPTQYATVGPGSADGTALKMVGSCDGGTFTMRSYPDRAGVAMTARLHDTAHTTWRYAGSVTPQRALDDFPPFAHGTLRNGSLVVHLSNLTEPRAAKNLDQGWPQMAGIGFDAGTDLQCGGLLSLTTDGGQFETPDFGRLDLLPSGTIRVGSGVLPSGGKWHVTVTVHSASGTQSRARSVRMIHERALPADTHVFDTTFNGFARLLDFTSVTVTASKPGQGRLWATITRTP